MKAQSIRLSWRSGTVQAVSRDDIHQDGIYGVSPWLPQPRNLHICSRRHRGRKVPHLGTPDCLLPFARPYVVIGHKIQVFVRCDVVMWVEGARKLGVPVGALVSCKAKLSRCRIRQNWKIGLFFSRIQITGLTLQTSDSSMQRGNKN